MNKAQLRSQLTRREDSRHQFKRDVTNADALAAELAAFANSGGGTLFLGVADNGEISGLDAAAVRRLNQLLTENVQTTQGIVMVVNVRDGLAKPYVDHQGRI